MKKLTRRNFLKQSAKTMAAVSLFHSTNIFTKSKKMKLPNIIYIHSHDSGRYIQPYGMDVPTPNIQKLASEGVLFRQNFCIGPTCSPSRSALLTGCYPHENGMLGLAHHPFNFSLKNYNQHIIHTLRKKGYLSVLTGVQHIAAPKKDKEPWEIIDYDKFLAGEQYKQAEKFLKNPPKQPFFLSVGFVETHRPYPLLKENSKAPDYCAPPKPLPDCPTVREDMARYKESAKILDKKMGVVFDALKNSEVADNTIVICTTDHGIAFPRMKCNLYDGGIATFLIIKGPGGFNGGKVINGMTTHMDIFPTICELTGIEKPKWLRGKSLLPLVNKQADKIHDDLFFELNFHVAYEPVRAVRTKRWKYIKRFDDYRHPVLPNCDNGLSKTYWLKNGWREKEYDREALYDLVFDPNEENNLINDKNSQGVLKELQARLKKWMKDTNDPLLSGPILPPPASKIMDKRLDLEKKSRKNLDRS